MKSSLISKTISILALASASFAAQAVPVLVFDNPSYVDSANAASESDLIQASLRAGGHTVKTFTSLATSDVRAALAGQSLLLIPELERGSLNTALSQQTIALIRSYVSNGGGLITSYDTKLTLNLLFGYSLVNAGSAVSTLNAQAAAGTAFAGGPATLPNHSAVLGYSMASLPTGAKSIYKGGNNISVVTLMGYGDGKIVQLGWDWFGATPATLNTGWQSVLNRAVEEVAADNKVPEPGSMALTGLALAALALSRRRRK